MSTEKILFEEIGQVDTVSTPLFDREELHIWILDLNHFPSDAGNSLDTVEYQRFQQISLDQQKQRFLASRFWLCHILGGYLNTPIQELKFLTSEKGKPSVCHPDTQLEFNLTHTKDHAALAIAASSQVGVDLELIRSVPTAGRIAEKVFTDDEIRQLEQLPAEQQAGYFFTCWTRMEARQKCMGLGIFNQRVSDEQVTTRTRELDNDLLLSVAWPGKAWQPRVRLLTPR